MARPEALEWWAANIKRADLSWVGHNVAYDMVVMMVACPASVPDVFRAYAEGRVHDTAIREMLLLNAVGRYNNVMPALADLAKKYANRDRSASKKGPDVWRLRYNELDGLPVAQWPDAARRYALDDASDTLAVAVAQGREPFWVHASGQLVNMVNADGSIVNESDQVRAALALQLMTVYGMRVDRDAALRLQAAYQDEADRLSLQLVELGYKRPDGSTDTAKVKRRVMDALTASATLQQRQAVDRAMTADREAFDAAELSEVAAGRKAKAGKWTATREHKSEVAAWVAQGFAMPTSDGGSIKTGAEILETIDDEHIALLVEYDAAYKRLTTYLEPMVRANGRALCPGYDVLKRSGRTSSYGPNVQNFPRKGGERACFIPRDGFLFVAADYSTLELRAWAQVCEDLGIASEMAVALRAGRDLHADLGAQLLNVTYEAFAAALDGHNPRLDKAKAKLFRNVSKPANFGLPVGMGAAKFEESARKSYGVDFSTLPVTASDVREAWYCRWTEAYPYFAHVKSLLVTVGHESVTLDDGTVDVREVRKCAIQHPRSGRVRGGCFFTDAANSYFQGMAADGAKAALFQLARECYADPDSPLFDCRPVAFIHDEVILEAPKARVQAAAVRLSEVMVSAMTEYIPDIPIVCEADIMDRWSKAAESKRRPDGTLSVYWSGVETLRSEAAKTDDPAARAELLERASALEATLEATLT
jgi:hypothetical protein